jgi:translation initiation factor RLI1
VAKPVAVVDYALCRPYECSEDGKCPACKECKYKVLKQEEVGEPPYQFGLCRGCATCATVCPRKAIKMM